MKRTTQQKFYALIFALTLFGATFAPTPAHAQAGSLASCSALAANSLLGGLGSAAGAAASAVSTALSVPVSNTSIEISSATTAGQATAQTTWQASMKPIQDCLVYGGGQLLLNQMTDSTINWIRGGFSGSPLYSVDPNKLFLDLADAASGGLARQIRGLQMCDFSGTLGNFQFDLANAIELSTRTNAEAKLADQLSCPFSSVIDLQSCNYPPDVQRALSTMTAAQRAQAQNLYCQRINPSQAAGEFFQDFSRGGWRAFETTLNDTGNPMGVSFKMHDELAARKTQTEKAVEKKQQNGFFDKINITTCNYPPELTINNTTPPEQLKIYQLQYCKTATPAKAIESSLSQTLGTDMSRIGFADSISKIVSALIEQVTQDATQGIFQ